MPDGIWIILAVLTILYALPKFLVKIYLLFGCALYCLVVPSALVFLPRAIVIVGVLYFLGKSALGILEWQEAQEEKRNKNLRYSNKTPDELKAIGTKELRLGEWFDSKPDHKKSHISNGLHFLGHTGSAASIGWSVEKIYIEIWYALEKQRGDILKRKLSCEELFLDILNELMSLLSRVKFEGNKLYETPHS